MTTPIVGEHAATQYAMTVLVPEVEEAQRLAAALDDVRRPEGALAVIAVPPVRGIAFFADAERQAKLDRWWAHAIPAGSVPVHLLLHEAGVAEWLPGLDGRFIIGVASPEDAELYSGMLNVTVAGGDALLDLALAVIDDFAGVQMFRDDASTRLEKRLRRPGPDAGFRFRRARLRSADEVFAGAPAAPAAHHHPIPNLPPQSAPDSAEPGRDELVRTLADTLRRLQQIRSTG